MVEDGECRSQSGAKCADTRASAVVVRTFLDNPRSQLTYKGKSTWYLSPLSLPFSQYLPPNLQYIPSPIV